MATDSNYWHQREYDFDIADRPAIFPHPSYGKYVFPAISEMDHDWLYSCPKFIAEQEHKQRTPLFAIKWMQGGKRVITGTSSGEIIIWHTSNFEYEKATSVHKDRVQAMCWTNHEKYLISGDKKGNIVYSNNKIA
jgi:WD40 repeat protein